MKQKNLLFYAILTVGIFLIISTLTIDSVDAATQYQKGMSSNGIKQLQTDLGKAGFKVVDKPTTYFGVETEKQVKAFQKKHKLTVDGIAGEKTLKKLKSVINEKSTSNSPTYYKKGMTHKNIKKLQEDLAKAGFKVVDKPTTYFGAQTEKQVKAFQKSNKLVVDGIAGKTTLDELKKAVKSPSKEKATSYYLKGMKHSGVKKLQEDLAKAGFKVVDKPTTYFGVETEKQVKAFQKKYKLLVDGVAGEATLKKLKSVIKKGFSSKPNSTKYYKKGMTDKGIKTLQQDLAKAGFKVVDNPTTYFGIQTEKQVKAFQKKYGLDVDGIAGVATLNKLKDVIKKGTKPSDSTSSKSKTNYNLSLDKAVSIQMENMPQTDKPFGWVSKTYIKNKKVTADVLNVRTGPSTSWANVGSLKKGTKVKILDEFKGWYAIEFSSATWKHAYPSDVENYLDPNKNNQLQHLRLDRVISSNTSDSKLKTIINNELSGKGILGGQAQAFINGARNNNINEFYLIVHAYLESGYGNSALANGYNVGLNSKGKAVLETKKNKGKLKNVKKVYNMFGIGAVDANPTEGGAITAYNNGWTSPALAIQGGAKWIGNQFVYNSYQQNTLYKMAWNPQMASGSAWKRYATDIGWASKQAGIIERLYKQLSGTDYEFDMPQYK